VLPAERLQTKEGRHSAPRSSRRRPKAFFRAGVGSGGLRSASAICCWSQAESRIIPVASIVRHAPSRRSRHDKIGESAPLDLSSTLEQCVNVVRQTRFQSGGGLYLPGHGNNYCCGKTPYICKQVISCHRSRRLLKSEKPLLMTYRLNGLLKNASYRSFTVAARQNGCGC
jgi:hypothetical protein